MRTAIALCVILLASVVAVAGQNPNVRLYVSFDADEYVPDFTPAIYTSFDAYICMDCLGTEGEPGGMCVIAFRTEITPGFTAVTSFSPMVSMPIPITWPELDGDIWMTPYGCITDDPCPLVRISMFYIGGSGCIQIVDHHDYPRWVIDSEDDVDFYCVRSHGSIAGGDCPPGEVGCDCGATPVDQSSWGVLKALYRQ